MLFTRSTSCLIITWFCDRVAQEWIATLLGPLLYAQYTVAEDSQVTAINTCFSMNSTGTSIDHNAKSFGVWRDRTISVELLTLDQQREYLCSCPWAGKNKIGKNSLWLLGGIPLLFTVWS